MRFCSSFSLRGQYLPDSLEPVDPVTTRQKLLAHIRFCFNLPAPDEKGYRPKKKALVIDAAPNMSEVKSIQKALKEGVDDGSLAKEAEEAEASDELAPFEGDLA